MTDSSPPYESLVEHAPVGVFQVSLESPEGDKTPKAPDEIYANKTLVNLLGFDVAILSKSLVECYFVGWVSIRDCLPLGLQLLVGLESE